MLKTISSLNATVFHLLICFLPVKSWWFLTNKLITLLIKVVKDRKHLEVSLQVLWNTRAAQQSEFSSVAHLVLDSFPHTLKMLDFMGFLREK